MYNLNIQKQRGFTLVEIAIVLVIIGLLLGGILKGQELITSARVRNIADQNSGIQAAYFGFIDRYRQVPGDMKPDLACQAIGSNPILNCPTGIGGDGNGRLNDEDFGEASALWSQLSAAGFIQGSYTGGATDDATYTPQTVAPINAFNGRVMLTRSARYSDTNASPASRLVFIIGSQIPVNVMRELDVKIDDSFPQSGVLRQANAGSPGPLATVITGPSATEATSCVTATTPPLWNIDSNSQNCSAMYLY